MGDLADDIDRIHSLDTLQDLWKNPDDYDNSIDTGFIGRLEHKKNKSCKYCGEENLHWLKIENMWRLVDKNSMLHSCEEYNNYLETPIPF